MVNDKYLEKMPQTNITHLLFVGSDHCPLLMEMSDHKDSVIMYFKFLIVGLRMNLFYRLLNVLEKEGCRESHVDITY